MLLPDRQTGSGQDVCDNVRLLNKLFYDTPAYSSAAHHPRMNLWASDQKAVVHALAPGVDKKDIDIQICGQNLVIEINCSPAASGCPTEEHSRGSAKSIALPFPVDADKVEARFNDVLLVIELPRLAFEVTRKIPIKP